MPSSTNRSSLRSGENALKQGQGKLLVVPALYLSAFVSEDLPDWAPLCELSAGADLIASEPAKMPLDLAAADNCRMRGEEYSSNVEPLRP
jgi:hypothetical protein